MRSGRMRIVVLVWPVVGDMVGTVFIQARVRRRIFDRLVRAADTLDLVVSVIQGFGVRWVH